jgi:hypothetical protein
VGLASRSFEPGPFLGSSEVKRKALVSWRNKYENQIKREQDEILEEKVDDVKLARYNYDRIEVFLNTMEFAV